MRSSHAIAIWLFERLDLEVALIGDLLEERERGRSAIWYWRQVLAAVWIAIWGAIRHHKLLALRATITGLAIEALLTFLWSSGQGEETCYTRRPEFPQQAHRKCRKAEGASCMKSGTTGRRTKIYD